MHSTQICLAAPICDSREPLTAARALESEEEEEAWSCSDGENELDELEVGVFLSILGYRSPYLSEDFAIIDSLYTSSAFGAAV